MHAQKDEERQVTLDDMPSEMINAIFGYLRPHDLTKMACVSKKYRDITQSILWGSIELHRQDAHHDAYGLSTQNDICRSYLDEELYDDLTETKIVLTSNFIVTTPNSEPLLESCIVQLESLKPGPDLHYSCSTCVSRSRTRAHHRFGT
jgi:hypothetical protein